MISPLICEYRSRLPTSTVLRSVLGLLRVVGGDPLGLVLSADLVRPRVEIVVGVALAARRVPGGEGAIAPGDFPPTSSVKGVKEDVTTNRWNYS